MLKKSFISLFLFISLFASASELVFPNPKVEELNPEENRIAASSLENRRELTKKILRRYTDAYNAEFRQKNNVALNPIHPDTLTAVLKQIDNATEAQLTSSKLETLNAVKKQYDGFAQNAFNLAKQDMINQLRFLGVSFDEISGMKLKLVQSDAKIMDLSSQITKLQAETVSLKKTIELLQKNGTTGSGSVASVPAAASQRQETVKVSPDSGILKIILMILAGFAVIYTFFKFRSK